MIKNRRRKDRHRKDKEEHQNIKHFCSLLMDALLNKTGLPDRVKKKLKHLQITKGIDRLLNSKIDLKPKG